MSNSKSGVERVVRRRRGPFKRSRTGCGTCKRRGKKCDEEWTPEGLCVRCVQGGFECAGRTAGPVRGASSGAQSHGGRSGSASDTAAGPVPSNGVVNHDMNSNGRVDPLSLMFPHDNGLPVTGLPAGTTTNGYGVSPTARSSSSNSIPTTSPLGGALPLDGSSGSQSLLGTGINPTPTSQPLSLSSEGVLPLNNLWSNNDYPTAADSRPPLMSFPFNQPLIDWPGLHTGPSAVLRTCPDGSLAIDATQPPSNGGMGDGLLDFWNDLSANFSPRPASGDAGRQTGFNAASRVLFLNGDKPMRQGVSLAEIYARVVESWLVGLPGPTRDYARARILALNDSNSVMRAVRYAVGAAYIFLFASDPETDDPDRRPKLMELACRGAGIVDASGNSVPRSATSPTNLSKSGEGGAVRKIRLYVDHVSTPFARDLESTKWTEDAVEELRKTVVTDEKQLSDLLWGVIDLQLVEFIRGGAAPSYNMLALGDRLVRSAFNCDHPPLTLSNLRCSELFSLRLFALSDVSRCIVQRGRRTIFNFWTADHTADQGNPLTPEDESWSTYLGLPDNIVILLAKVVNLCAELPSMQASAVKTQADDIENALQSWQPASLAHTGLDSAALISRAIAGELWRHCAIILLYQSVHRVGGVHPVLRRARAEMLSLLGSVTQLPNGDLWGFIALPAFLAATLSITDADRKRSMTFLVRTGPERVWLDNIALVEKVWEETDETGRLVDWHDKMVREGLSVAFF